VLDLLFSRAELERWAPGHFHVLGFTAAMAFPVGEVSTLGQLPHENKTGALFTTSVYESILQSTICTKGNVAIF